MICQARLPSDGGHTKRELLKLKILFFYELITKCKFTALVLLFANHNVCKQVNSLCGNAGYENEWLVEELPNYFFTELL